jgi:hypothetical protein
LSSDEIEWHRSTKPTARRFRSTLVPVFRLIIFGGSRDGHQV